MTEGLRDVFLRMGREVLARHQDLPHSWTQKDSTTTLEFPKKDGEGFEVSVVASDAEVTVCYQGGHEHFGEGSFEEIVRDALGLVRDLLTTGMRVRELWAGNRPYRWYLETHEGGTWRTESVTGLLIWNYFGHRSERIYQNRSLPGRLGAY